MTHNPNQLPISPEANSRKNIAARVSARLLIEKLSSTPSIESRIEATKGPFVEVGAVPSNPLPKDSIINMSKIDKQLLTSNHYRPETIATHYRQRFTKEPKIITHRDQAPNPRFYRATGSEFKTAETGSNWIDYTAPVYDDVDLIADATNLPFRDGSIGSLYSIALHPSAEPVFVNEEAPRALEPGGILVVDGVKPDSLATASPYFDVLKITRNKDGEITNYAAMRNNLPYQRPDVATTTLRSAK